VNQRTVELLLEAGSAIGIDMEPRDDYSGRGMYGRTTSAIVVESLSDFLGAAVQAGVILGETRDPYAAEFIGDVQRARTDSMGRRTVLY